MITVDDVLKNNLLNSETIIQKYSIYKIDTGYCVVVNDGFLKYLNIDENANINGTVLIKNIYVKVDINEFVDMINRKSYKVDRMRLDEFIALENIIDSVYKSTLCDEPEQIPF